MRFKSYSRRFWKMIGFTGRVVHMRNHGATAPELAVMEFETDLPLTGWSASKKYCPS